MIEVKSYTQTVVKAVDDAQGYIEGYASTFGNADLVGDIIDPKAFDNVIKDKLPLMFFNHDSYSLPIGKWIEWSVDEKGLYMKGQLNLDLPVAKDIYSSLKFGSLNGLSVSMLLSKNDIEETSKTRLIKNVTRMPEVSVVSMPCNTEATISRTKSFEQIDNIRDFEKALSDLGASHKEALTLVARAKHLFSNSRDVETKDEAQTNLCERLNRINNLF